MSLIRQDPTTKEWVILAAQRGQRPHDFTKAKPERAIAQMELMRVGCMSPFITFSFENGVLEKATGNRNWADGKTEFRGTGFKCTGKKV